MQNYVILTGISEKPDLREDLKKIYIVNWADFYNYRMDVYTHFQHAFIFKQLEKWILHLVDAFIQSDLKLGNT